jgi:hypothetical protein
VKLFTCSGCGNLVYFENVSCTRCGATLGFVPEETTMAAFEAAGPRAWKRTGGDRLYRMCENYAEHAVCNWTVPAEGDEAFCAACRLNRTIPDLGVAGNRPLWHAVEVEKRRLVYSLLRLRLPVAPRSREESGLAFDLLADAAPRFSERGRVLTGHAQGLITINVAEADPAERARMRDEMDEPYRTVLGHFRHESGHYYWDRLVRDGPWLDEFHALFGDETADYGGALDHHYASGPPERWHERFVSSYASCHPWEDWAESWAHYLHIVDTLETAYQFGLAIRPRAGDAGSLEIRHGFDPYREGDSQLLVDHWLPLTFALNSLNRSMGHEHAYPFVLAPAVIEKLGFVHRVVRSAGSG